MFINKKTKIAIENGKKVIPGLTQLLSKRPDMLSPDIWPTYFKKAKGVEIWDLDGNKYVDMSISGVGANILGYSVAEINTPVIQAIENGVSCSLNCYEDVELAEMLLSLHPWAQQVRYARCGGEAMTVAVRIARAATGRDKVAFCGYHGWHDWYLAANIESNNNLDDHLIAGLSPAGVPKVLDGTAIPFEFNNINKLKEILAKHGRDMAAVIMEPMRNIKPDKGYWLRVQALCAQYELPLIIDEISMGFRLNCGGSHLVLGIQPDIAVFSKAMANGHAMAAIIGKEHWMEAVQKSFISSTMWTERVGPTAALATIDYYQQNNVHKHLKVIGDLVINGWETLAYKHKLNLHVTGIPALSHFSIESNNFQKLKSYFIQLMYEQGFLATNMVYVMYAHKEHHIVQYLDAVDNAFAKLSLAVHNNEYERYVTPSTVGFKRLN
jgi:glutamate-1-semialdehyde 2,1-aminomutase